MRGVGKDKWVGLRRSNCFVCIAAEVEERLESELFEAQERVVQLEGEMSEMQATMKVQVEEKDVELEKLREENEFKDLLVGLRWS